MNNLWIIVKREYVQMVCRKSFIITTLLVPILSILFCCIVPVMLSQVQSDEKKNVAVIDLNPGAPFAAGIEDDGAYRFLHFDAELKGSAPAEVTEDQADPSDRVAETDARQLFDRAKSDGLDLYALVVIPEGFVGSARYSIYSEKNVSADLDHSLSRSLQHMVRDERIAQSHIDSLRSIIDYCNPTVSSRSIKLGEDGQESLSSAEVTMMIGLVLAFLTYMFVCIYGSLIMNSVVEEKTNRIVEVIVSTCRPIQLMLGKITGVALVGLTQIFLWVVLLGLGGVGLGVYALSSVDLTQVVADPAVQQQMGEMQQLAAAQGLGATHELSPVQELVLTLSGVDFVPLLVCFVLYFVGGYLLYASLFAAFGSAVDQASDTSQFVGPLMMVMLFSLYAGMFCMENPDGPLAFWCSMIPFTSPIVMMIRLPYDLPLYEIAASLVLLYASAFGILWLSARIYRTGILMYGRKFTFKEILRWIRQ